MTTTTPATSYDLDSDEFSARVESLMREAAAAGDMDMADICAAALRGSMVARMRCAEVLRDAEAQARE